MRWTWLLVLPGCLLDQDRFVERQKALCHPEYGCTDRPWWPDADGDGWGDPAADPIVSPEPVSGRVNNLLDCDDTTVSITADTSGLCPSAFGEALAVTAGVTNANLGDGDEQAEWVVVVLDDPLLLFEAEDRCEPGWGGFLGGPRSAIEGSADPIWVTGRSLPVHASWTAVGGPVPDGPLIWDGTGLVAAAPDTVASVACMRPVPDPHDWETFGVPE